MDRPSSSAGPADHDMSSPDVFFMDLPLPTPTGGSAECASDLWSAMGMDAHTDPGLPLHGVLSPFSDEHSPATWVAPRGAGTGPGTGAESMRCGESFTSPLGPSLSSALAPRHAGAPTNAHIARGIPACNVGIDGPCHGPSTLNDLTGGSGRITGSPLEAVLPEAAASAPASLGANSAPTLSSSEWTLSSDTWELPPSHPPPTPSVAESTPSTATHSSLTPINSCTVLLPGCQAGTGEPGHPRNQEGMTAVSAEPMGIRSVAPSPSQSTRGIPEPSSVRIASVPRLSAELGKESGPLQTQNVTRPMEPCIVSLQDFCWINEDHFVRVLVPVLGVQGLAPHCVHSSFTHDAFELEISGLAKGIIYRLAVDSLYGEIQPHKCWHEVFPNKILIHLTKIEDGPSDGPDTKIFTWFSLRL